MRASSQGLLALPVAYGQVFEDNAADAALSINVGYDLVRIEPVSLDETLAAAVGIFGMKRRDRGWGLVFHRPTL